MNSNILMLITTEGCYACNVMKRNVTEAYNNCKDYSLIINDVIDVPEYIKANVSLTDFPTLLLIKNDKIISRKVGTLTVDEIKKLVFDLGFI